MNAAKKIRQFIETQENPMQVQVLKDLAAALELGQPFNLQALYEIDMRYFDVAIQLMQDWRFDHHIASRSKLAERLFVQMLRDQSHPGPVEEQADSTAQAAESSEKITASTTDKPFN